MKIDATIIQVFPDELFKSYWVPWCELFLNEKLDILERDLHNFNIKLISGMSQNSDPATRAIELFRTGVLIYPISLNGSKTKAWFELFNSRSIISDFGYITYLISKALSKGSTENEKLKKAFSAICAICAVKQTFRLKDSSNFPISINTVFQKIINSFELINGDDLELQYLASAMICTVNSESHNQKLINSVISDKNIDELVITYNKQNGGEVRDFIDSQSITDYIYKVRSKELSFNDTTNQRFSNFYVGNHSKNPKRGFINAGREFFEDFLIEYSEIEIENWDQQPFKELYSKEKGTFTDLPNSNTLNVLNEYFYKYSSKPEIIDNLMISLQEGCIEALKKLNWLEMNMEEELSIHPGYKNFIYYGAPGTGKSHVISNIVKDKNTRTETVTFHPEYDYFSFVGGYKPTSKKGSINYEFVPQAFINIYVKAWNDSNNDYYLVIEEINRGNCAEIFGDMFQLLDRNPNYKITPSDELKSYLEEQLKDTGLEGIRDGKMKFPPNLTILASMNTSDQSLFPMDSAFKRRWEWIYMPICYDSEVVLSEEKKEKNLSYNYKVEITEGVTFRWIDFIEKINNEHIITNRSLGMDKCIGNYFVKPETGNLISLNSFISKVVFYLWNDVFKDEENKVFEENTSYESFFPIKKNGPAKVTDLLSRLGISIDTD